MKRNWGFALPLSAVGFGIAGLLLRRWQLATAFEADTGLLLPGQPASIVLVAVCVLAAAAALGLSAALFRGEAAPKGYLANLAAPHPAVGALTVLAGALLLAGGLLGVRDYALGINESVIRLIQGIALIPCGVCAGLIALLGQQREEGKGRFHGALPVPAYCGCVWLVAVYQGHTANPNIMEYAFLLLGIVCAIFACYAAASFSFEKPRPMLCGAMSALGVTLLMVAAGDRPWGMDLMCVVGFAAYLLAQLICLVSCRIRPPRLEVWTPPAEEPETQAPLEDRMTPAKAPEDRDTPAEVQPRGEENE